MESRALSSLTRRYVSCVLTLFAFVCPHIAAFAPFPTIHHSRGAALGFRDERSGDPPSQARQEWVERSLNYYKKVMREERRRNLGQVQQTLDDMEYQQHYTTLAKKHYFALRKIKDGKFEHAEYIYRRILGELLIENEEHCDHAQLAVTTLLLALLLQRKGDTRKTRAVFVNFFRIVTVENNGQLTQCACSAKVLQAFALFEMKQGNALKSLELVNKAVQLDPALTPVLHWKQFRDASKRRSQS